MSKRRENSKKRTSVAPPPVEPGVDLFTYLQKAGLERKIIDIAISQTQVPNELREDASQEIRTMWATCKPDLAFEPGQIASYAHRIARHCCLRLRRELGSSVRLPGSAFRKRKDGSSYVTPGVLAAPLDWNELEGWFQTDKLADFQASTLQQAALDAVMSEDEAFDEQKHSNPEDEESFDPDEENLTHKRRLAVMPEVTGHLEPRQQRILEQLLSGRTYDDIQEELGIKRATLMRIVNDMRNRILRANPVA